MNATNAQSKYTFFGESDFESDDFHLDSEVEERIREGRRNKKIAFMSGCHRTYFPEKPGNSKFAQVYTPFGDPKIPKAKIYVSQESRHLNKPVSTRGYGMGGLSGPRFADEVKKQQPGPGEYFKTTTARCEGKQHGFPPQVWMNFGLLKPEDSKKLKEQDINKRLTGLWDKCSQIRVAFGTNMKQPRFGKEPKWNLVGPGAYVVRQWKQTRYIYNNGFMRGPAIFNPSTKVHCSYGPKDSCVECGRQLMSSSDYYRSRYNVHLTPIAIVTAKKSVGRLDFRKTESVIRQSQAITNTRNSMDEDEEGRKRRPLLCRNCYCNALKGESKYWKTKKEVENLFEKTRHCGFMHEHNGMPQIVEKASCRLTRRLMRREAILSLHWPDKCTKRMVAKKNV